MSGIEQPDFQAKYEAIANDPSVRQECVDAGVNATTRLLVVSHPSCAVQGNEARAIIAASRNAELEGRPIDVSTSDLVPEGQLIVIDSAKLDEGLRLPLGR